MTTAPTTWLKDVSLPSFSPLQDSLTVDVAIIGGGITAFLNAYYLTQLGKTVAILEKNTICSGATGYTTAFLSNVIDTSVQDVIKMTDQHTATVIMQSHQAAVHVYKSIVTMHSIDCEFTECDNYLYSHENSEIEYLQSEADALVRLGIEASFTQSVDIGLQKPAHAITIKGQAKLHPTKFMNGLIRTLDPTLVHIFEHTNVESVTKQDDTFTVHTSGGNITADWCIAATHHPFEQPLGLYFKKAQYRSYVYEVQYPKGSFPEAKYIDTHSPYHYARVDPQHTYDRLIIGGEDHREDIPMDPAKNYEALLGYITQEFGSEFEVKEQWYGPIMEPSDGLALLGSYKDPKMLYATGYSGTGFTYAAISALLFSDLIQDKENEWAEIYQPSRMLSLSNLAVKGKDYAHELYGGAIKNMF